MSSRFRTFAIAASVAVALAAAPPAARAAAPLVRPSAQAPARPNSHAAGRSHAPLQGYSPAAQRVLAQARAASGGAGWSLLRGWRETGHQRGATYDRWFDTLRYGMRIETRGADGLSVRGFNGQGAWRIAPNGEATGIEPRLQVAQARTEAFLGANGFLYPGRFDAHGESLGVRQAQGRAFDVVSVSPWDGVPVELWFDSKTHLLARVVEGAGPQSVTTELSDYRRVGPIRVAFHIVVRGAGPAGTEDRRVDSVVFTPADRDMFSLPRPAAP